MTCPSCGGELVPGAERCPVCDASSVAPRVEGALAADPRLVTPPARPKRPEPPLRELPGQRRREKSWRDEVQERVRSRRQKRADSGLPLFDDEAGATQDAPPAAAPAPDAQPPASLRYDTAPVEPAPALPAPDPVARRSHPEETLPPFRTVQPAPAATRPSPRSIALPGSAPELDRDLVSPGLSEAELADLPLHAALPAADLEALDREVGPLTRELGPPPELPRQPAPTLDDHAVLDAGDDEPALELSAPVPEPPPLERPARAGERVQAAAVDLALFAALAAVVLYFAGRAARVEVAALLAASWHGIVAYLALLALFYAGYFSGTTGQTPGKLVTGLRVVDTSGRPPGYLRAAFGLAGVTAAGLGLLPIVFDPAGRALHDRLLRTRVVRR
jgi:uncharacterized RDD family membrane protein YckC